MRNTPEWLDDIMDTMEILLETKIAVSNGYLSFPKRFEISSNNTEFLILKDTKELYDYYYNILNTNTHLILKYYVIPSYVSLSLDKKIPIVIRLVFKFKITFIFKWLLKFYNIKLHNIIDINKWAIKTKQYYKIINMINFFTEQSIYKIEGSYMIFRLNTMEAILIDTNFRSWL